MARWRNAPRRAEPPAWYRVFIPGDWDTPDEQEQAMMAGCPSMRPWPDDVHGWHAQRRWCAAKSAYAEDHPELADAELAGLLALCEGMPGGQVA